MSTNTIVPLALHWSYLCTGNTLHEFGCYCPGTNDKMQSGESGSLKSYGRYTIDRSRTPVVLAWPPARVPSSLSQLKHAWPLSHPGPVAASHTLSHISLWLTIPSCYFRLPFLWDAISIIFQWRISILCQNDVELHSCRRSCDRAAHGQVALDQKVPKLFFVLFLPQLLGGRPGFRSWQWDAGRGFFPGSRE